MSTQVLLRSFLEPRAGQILGGGLDWLASATDEVGDRSSLISDTRFGALLSLASRKMGHAARQPWTLGSLELDSAGILRDGWNPAHWTPLEAARVILILARPDLEAQTGADAIESAFRFADEGELCALYRSLAHLPGGERFVWRAAEGCRTNMVSVFKANVLDTPFPAEHFDEVAFNQAAIKALFVEVPLSRLWSLDRRLSRELARMALDLADERRSAGRSIYTDLWLCLGTFGGERGLKAIETELAPIDTIDEADHEAIFGLRAAVLALGRAGHTARLRELASPVAGANSIHSALAVEAELGLTGDANQIAWSRFVAPALT